MQPGPILDYAWYPTASPANPAAFCFVASVRETPVKLLDASDGRVCALECSCHPTFIYSDKLRASYPIVDHRERQIAPHCLAFNMLGTRSCSSCLFGRRCTKRHRTGCIADLSTRSRCLTLGVRALEHGSRPHHPKRAETDSKAGGSQYDPLLHLTLTPGIISALAFSPSYDSDFYAAGSLAATSGNIALFSGEEAVPTHYVDGGPAAGVTQVRARKFTSSNETNIHPSCTSTRCAPWCGPRC